MYDNFARAFHDYFTRNPNWNVHLGVDRLLDELPDPSLAEAASRVEEARGLLTQLDAIRASGTLLSFDETLDLDLAQLMLDAEIHRETFTFNGRTQRQQIPSCGRDIGDGIHTMFIVDPRPASERLADITTRIEKVPAYLDELVARLDTPVERWVAIDLDEAGGLPLLFSTIQDWARREGWSDAGRVDTAVEIAGRAVGRYLERLRELPTTAQFHMGDKHARRLVELMGIELSFEQLHALARDFLARTNDSVERLRARLVEKYDLGPATTAAALHNALNERYGLKVRDDDFGVVLDRYEAERRHVLQFVRERDLFPVPDAQDMKIIQTPDFMVPTIPAAAMTMPAPFRAGIRTSIIFLTLSQERLPEHTELGIPGMMIHEGIPGHHLQLATAAMHPSIIRRHVDASDHAEGWTTMLEDYMLDHGYMGNLVDEARFIAKRGIARIGARVAIDLFFMTGDREYLDVGVDCNLTPQDPFAAAANLLGAVTGFTPGRAQGELNWYSMERGVPLTYLTGNTLVWDLKRDVEAHAARRDPPLTGLALDREFHRIYLESGNMPVRFLRRVFAEHGFLLGSV